MFDIKLTKKLIVREIDKIEDMFHIDMTNAYLVKKYALMCEFYDLASFIDYDYQRYIKFIEDNRCEWIPIDTFDAMKVMENPVSIDELLKFDDSKYEKDMEKKRKAKYLLKLIKLEKERKKLCQKKNWKRYVKNMK